MTTAGEPGHLLHDLNGILSRVLLAADALADHEDERVARRGRQIGLAASQMADLCRDELSPDPQLRRRAATLDDGAIGDLLNRVAALASAGAEGGRVAFDVSVETGAAVRCAPHALFRALYNLAVNAVAASDPRSGGRVRLSARRAESGVAFEVADDGPGLPSSVIDRLDLPRPKTQVRSGRVGVGLFAAAALAADIGGRLSLVETGAGGTCFRVLAPAAANLSPESAAAALVVAV